MVIPKTSLVIINDFGFKQFRKTDVSSSSIDCLIVNDFRMVEVFRNFQNLRDHGVTMLYYEQNKVTKRSLGNTASLI